MGEARGCLMQLPSPRLFKQHFVHFLLRSDEKFVWQASTPWNQFTLDQTLGTDEGRRKLYEGKVLDNWMKEEEPVGRSPQICTAHKN